MILQRDGKKNIIGGTSEIEPSKHISPKFLIGIDPDVHKNGYAVYDKKERKLVECTCLSFFELMKELQKREELFKKFYWGYLVTIEGGWLKKKQNWHGHFNHVAEAISRKVGENHAVGKKIVELCIELDCPFKVVEPSPAIFNQEFYFQKVTGWKGKTNKDSRAAARYVYGF